MQQVSANSAQPSAKDGSQGTVQAKPSGHARLQQLASCCPVHLDVETRHTRTVRRARCRRRISAVQAASEVLQRWVSHPCTATARRPYNVARSAPAGPATCEGARARDDCNITRSTTARARAPRPSKATPAHEGYLGCARRERKGGPCGGAEGGGKSWRCRRFRHRDRPTVRAGAAKPLLVVLRGTRMPRSRDQPTSGGAMLARGEQGQCVVPPCRTF
jgi:hypothetical protein